MVPIELLERYERKINELIDLRVGGIIGGNAEDFSTYQRLTGEVRGLRLAVNELQELLAEQNHQ